MEFTKYKLYELGTVYSGGTPSTKNAEYWDGNIPWITPKDLSGYKSKYISSGERSITELGLQKSSAILIPKRSILMSSRAPIGYVVINENEVTTNQGFKSINCNEDKCLNEYMYYWIKNNVDYITSKSNGSTFKEISGTSFKELIVKVPSLVDQAKIVNILGNIDKKIELNNEINNNLQELSKLNYSTFIKSIEGNEECKYKDFAELGKIIMGQSPKGESYNYERNGLPLINGAADYEDAYLKAQKYTSKPIKNCNKNDLLFCIRATIGLLVICDKEYCLGRGVAGITNIDPVYREYAYHIIDSSIEDFKRMATGSVIVGISRDNIENISVKIPSRVEIEKYHSVEKPIFDKVENLRIENKRLKQLRDILLPKLMNCKIDLDKIEI